MAIVLHSSFIAKDILYSTGSIVDDSMQDHLF